MPYEPTSTARNPGFGRADLPTLSRTKRELSRRRYVLTADLNGDCNFSLLGPLAAVADKK
jgi:hypothetical protein